jgi:membrane protein implicated in regulation of membrane protease activity
MTKILISVLMVLLLLAPSGAPAYIGPGAGISVLGSLLGILATFFVAIGAIIFWPLRKFMKRRKTRRQAMDSVEATQDGAVVSGDDRSGDDRSGDQHQA